MSYTVIIAQVDDAIVFRDAIELDDRQDLVLVKAPADDWVEVIYELPEDDAVAVFEKFVKDNRFTARIDEIETDD